MKFFSYILLLVTLGFINCVAHAEYDDDTIITKEDVIEVPVKISPPTEVILAHPRYNCFIVSGHSSNNGWVPEHNACQYTLPASWVGSYWQCTQYNRDGTCTDWRWGSSYW